MNDLVEMDGLSLSAAERDSIIKLRNKVKDCISQEKYEDTYYTYSFLKGEDFNIEQAEKNLRESIEFKKRIQADKILTDYKIPEVFQGYLTNSRFATAKDGSVVHFLHCGNLDIKGVHNSMTLNDIEKMMVREIEEDEIILLQNRKTKNGPYPGCIWIYDIENVKFSTATDKKAINYFLRLMTIYEKYYPDRVKTLYILNVHSYFTLSFNIIKMFVNSTSLKKLRLCGDDYKEVLLDIIDRDQLPAFLGGSGTDPDGNPLCLTFMCHCGKIDERFYTKKTKNSMASSPGVEKLTLSRASFSEIFVEVEEAGSVIEWEFETKLKDIGFGVFLKEIENDEEKITEMVPLLRLETEERTEVGLYKCERAGTYIILFDNSYSWLRSKVIYYKISVVKPEDLKKKMQEE